MVVWPELGSERPFIALAGEASEDAAAVVVEGLDEIVAFMCQDAGRGDLIDLAGTEVAFDHEVASTEGVGGDRGGELEQEQRPERRLSVQVAGRGQADSAPIGAHARPRSMRASWTSWAATMFFLREAATIIAAEAMRLSRRGTPAPASKTAAMASSSKRG